MTDTHKGLVTNKQTGELKWVHLREAKFYWIQGMYYWEKPRKSASGYVEHAANKNLSLDMVTIIPLTRDDLRRPYLDAVTAAQMELDQWDLQHPEGTIAREQEHTIEVSKGVKMYDLSKSPVDCGDSSCICAYPLTGMRTNGGCRCGRRHPTEMENVRELRNALMWWRKKFEEKKDDTASS